MKKTVALVLAVVLLLSFAGCGETKFEGPWTVTEWRSNGTVYNSEIRMNFSDDNTCSSFFKKNLSYSVNGDQMRIEDKYGHYVVVKYTIEDKKNKEMSWDIVGGDTYNTLIN